MTGNRVRFDSYLNDEFLGGAIRLAALNEWAKAKGLHLLAVSERAVGAEIVGVQTYLTAIAEQAVALLSDEQALNNMSDILEAQPEYLCDPRERKAVLEERRAHTARYMLQGKVWVAWRDRIRQALDAGELSLVDGMTALPLAWPGAVSAMPVATDVVEESIKAEPIKDGLRTREIAVTFDDLNDWDKNRWTKNLSSAKWLHPARTALGSPGVASAAWNPLTLAQLMHEKAKSAKEKEQLMKHLHSRFNRNPVLMPWRDDFNEYFATYCTPD
jgi:hypothetical protein